MTDLEEVGVAAGGAGPAEEDGTRTRVGAISLWVMGIVVPVAVILDQVTKQLAHGRLALGEVIQVVEGFFLLTYSRNRGAFFSLGEDLPDGARRAFFIVATLAAVALIVHLYRRAATRTLSWGLLCLLAGALGNLVDRVLYGEVIDFLHLHYGEVFHWATFNLADVYITAGLVLLVVDVLRPPRAAARAAAAPEAGAAGSEGA